jgi:hypothetical protein
MPTAIRQAPQQQVAPVCPCGQQGLCPISPLAPTAGEESEGICMNAESADANEEPKAKAGPCRAIARIKTNTSSRCSM